MSKDAPGADRAMVLDTEPRSMVGVAKEMSTSGKPKRRCPELRADVEDQARVDGDAVRVRKRAQRVTEVVPAPTVHGIARLSVMGDSPSVRAAEGPGTPPKVVDRSVASPWGLTSTLAPSESFT